jgi:hypothetical protein
MARRERQILKHAVHAFTEPTYAGPVVRAAVLLVCLGVLATGCGSETPQPSGAVSTPAAQATSMEAASHAFTSELYGFELVLPSRWQSRAALTEWVSGGIEGRCPSAWDCFEDTTESRTLAIAAIDVPKNTTLEEWQARIHRSAPSFCEDSDPPSETTLDGERALTWTTVCEVESLKAIKLATLHGRRAYMFLFDSPTTTSLESDQAVYDSIMSTFHFTAR